MYDRILVPTDGSDTAMRAAERAIKTAETYDAEIHIVHCLDTPKEVMESTGVGASSAPVSQQMREMGEEAMDEIEEKAGDLTVHRTLLNGKASERIVNYADENDIDLIVMGTHGRTGLNRLLLGSVTEAVLRKCDCPVLSVK